MRIKIYLYNICTSWKNMIYDEWRKIHKYEFFLWDINYTLVTALL